MAEPVVARETAEQEFVRMAGAFRIDLAPREGELAEAVFKQSKDDVVDAMMEGRLICDAEGMPTYRLAEPLKDSTQLTFKKPTGATFMAMDDSMGKPFTRWATAAQDMTGSKPGLMSRLGRVDFEMVCTLTRLFLGQG